MKTIGLLVLFMPVLVMMGGLWINCSCLDSLPKHAFALKRHHIRWATVFLVMLIMQMGVSSQMAIQMIQDQHQQSMEQGK